MPKIYSALKFAACLTGLALCVAASGCGGGVDSETEVVLKPSRETAPPAAPGGAGAGGGAVNNATTDTENATAQAGGYGVLRGRVVYNGDAPEQGIKFAVGKASADANYCAAVNPILDQKLVVDPETKGIANVFIWLEEMPEGGKESAAHEADWTYTFDQENCTFKPHAMVVRTGKPLTIVSSDRVKHNVNISAFRNPGFNQSMGLGEKIEHTYQSPERVPVQVKCDIHTWMTAYHFPVEHPYAALTDDKGAFQIADLPVGEHEFRIWHESKGYLRGGRITVTIEPGDNEQTIQISPAEVQAGFDGPRPRTILLSSRDAAGH